MRHVPFTAAVLLIAAGGSLRTTEAPPGPRTIPWILASIVLPALLAHALTRGLLRKPKGEQMRILAGRSTAAGLLILASYAAVIFILEWPVFLENLLGPGASRLPLVLRFGTLLPALAIALPTTWVLHRVENRIRGLREGYLGFVAGAARLDMVLLLPYAAIMGLADLRFLVPALDETFYVRGWLGVLAVAAMGVLLVTVAPFIVRIFWPVEPLPRGPLRQGLESIAIRAGVRYRDLLVWRTGRQQVLTAGIVGWTARSRYVIFTDAMIASFPGEEIGAVFAHELGHARHRHVVVYLGYGLAFLLGAYLGLDATDIGSGDPGALSLLAGAAIGIGVWAFLFGIISRRFEVEADIYAVDLLGDPGPFIRALDRAQDLSGGRSRSGWRHFGIPRRKEYVIRAGERNTRARTRRFRRIVWAGTSTALLATAVAMAAHVRSEQHRPRHRILYLRGECALSHYERWGDPAMLDRAEGYLLEARNLAGGEERARYERHLRDIRARRAAKRRNPGFPSTDGARAEVSPRGRGDGTTGCRRWGASPCPSAPEARGGRSRREPGTRSARPGSAFACSGD